MTVAYGWAHVTINVTMAVLAQPLQIAIVVSPMPVKIQAELAYAMMDTEVKAVPSG